MPFRTRPTLVREQSSGNTTKSWRENKQRPQPRRRQPKPRRQRRKEPSSRPKFSGCKRSVTRLNRRRHGRKQKQLSTQRSCNHSRTSNGRSRRGRKRCKPKRPRNRRKRKKNSCEHSCSSSSTAFFRLRT